MKKLNSLILIGIVSILSAFSISESINWNISEDYSIKFSGTKIKGKFKDLKGDVQFNKNNLAASKFSFTVDVKSISTGNWLKTRHAKGKKWFNAKSFPNIEFNSSKFSKTESGYEVTGTMEMHGNSKEMTIPFSFDDNIFSAQFSINRMDFNVGTMKGMSKKVSNEIKLEIQIPVTKQ